MAGWALAVSIASLVVAIGTAALTWYLWQRSGPEIVVQARQELFADFPSAVVEVLNSGRMAAVIREVGLQYRLEDGTFLRPVKLGPADDEHPVTIPPTGGFRATVKPTPWLPSVLQAYAIQGDGHEYVSPIFLMAPLPPFRERYLRGPDPAPRPGGESDPGRGDEGEGDG